MVLIRPMRCASGAAASCDIAVSSHAQKKKAPAAVSESSKRWKSQSASSVLMAKPPANESTLKSAASFHTTPREVRAPAGWPRRRAEA
jgi:hypothetical protein